MSKIYKIMVTICVVFSIVLSTVLTVQGGKTPITNVLNVNMFPYEKGQFITSTYDENNIRISLISSDGVITKHTDIARTQGEYIISIPDMVTSEDGLVYFIKNYSDSHTGKLVNQELAIYDFGSMFVRNARKFNITEQEQNDTEEPYTYNWLGLSGDNLSLLGISTGGDIVSRRIFDAKSMIENNSYLSKGLKYYPVNNIEGVYQVKVTNEGIIYSTKSGKLFKSDESTTAEIYPNTYSELKYPMFLEETDQGEIIIGEQESGNLLSVDTTSGDTQTLKIGTEPFSGLSSYTASDIITMSMSSETDFIGVVYNKATSTFEFVTSTDNEFTQISYLKLSFAKDIIEFSKKALLYFVISILVLFIIQAVIVNIKNSRRILNKLIFSTMPLLIVSIVIFGAFTVNSYSKSMQESFYKQVEDEGNMLTALFGTDSFEEIEFPFDYTGEAYTYLANQMATREAYTRVVYLQDDTLYVGVDRNLPCFYPETVLMSGDSEGLYMTAAYSGKPVTGKIDDANGERIVCVTPIGGASGNVVFLFESGVYIGNMNDYVATYIRTFILIAAIFLIIICAILIAGFVNIMKPLHSIKDGLEEFSKGNLNERLKITTNDELSDICRVFNKMTGDIQTQMVNLKNISETYYRFIPQRIFEILDKKSFSELNLDSTVEKNLCILDFSLTLKDEKLDLKTSKELINSYFNIINKIAEEGNATLISDRANLRSLKVICPDGADSAMNIGISALAHIDSFNAKIPIHKKLNVSVILHYASAFFGICGDENRYIQAFISPDFDKITASSKELRQYTSRFIVTSAAYALLADNTKYYNRFIGYLDFDNDTKLGLYDFYDCQGAEITGLINDTKTAFDKAMELYLQGRYYEAKNLFTIVLRSNQYDNVARSYIFKCDSLEK